MGTTFLIAVIIGALLGAASSLVTRRMGVWPGVVFAAVFATAAALVAGLTSVELGAVLTAMLAFAVTAAIFDPRSGTARKKLATS